MNRRTLLLGAAAAALAAERAPSQTASLLITGDMGKVGGCLVPHFKSLGFNVIGADIKRGPMEDVANLNGTWTGSVKQSAAVIHLAVCGSVAPNSTREQDHDCVDHNDTETALCAMRLCEKYRVPFVFASSTWTAPGKYGNPSYPNALLPVSWYGRSKTCIEDYGRWWSKATGIGFSIVRIGVFYSGAHLTSTDPLSLWSEKIRATPETIAERFTAGLHAAQQGRCEEFVCF